MVAHDSTARVALYARVSTTDQSTDSQLLDLRRYVADRGWQIHSEYWDNGISGTKESRPALDELMADARKRRFDAVLVWRFDRFARSTKHLILALKQALHLRGCSTRAIARKLGLTKSTAANLVRAVKDDS